MIFYVYEVDLKKILIYLNGLRRNVHVTLELDQNQSLNFLDLKTFQLLLQTTNINLAYL